MFIELLEEIQEQILEYCSTRDIKNLTLTNSIYNQLLRPYLCKTVRAPETQPTNEQQLLDRLNWFEDAISFHLRTDIHSFSTAICDVISTFTKLKELYLPRIHDSTHAKVDDTHVGILCRTLLNLRTFDLSGSSISAKGSTCLSGLKKLRKLILIRCQHVDFKAVQSISTLPLVELSLRSSPIGTISFSEVCKMRLLQSLDLSWCEKLMLTTFGLIGRLRELTELKVNGLALDDDNFSIICQLRQLQVLEIGWCDDITNLGFRYIVNLVDLIELRMNGCAIGNYGFESVCELTKLQKLDMGWCSNVVGMGYSPMTSLIHLKELILDGCLVGHDVFSQVCQLTSLEELHMCRCQGLKNLTDLTSLKALKKLNLSGTDVSRNIILGIVRVMPCLRILDSNGNIFIIKEEEFEDSDTFQEDGNKTPPSVEGLPSVSSRQRRIGQVGIVR